MKKSRFSEEQMVKILREADRTPITEVAKKHGVSEQTIYVWRRRFGKMDVADTKKLKALEAENARLKKMVADRDLELADRPGRRRRDVHRRLVGLERDERVLLGHRVAGAHHHLDDGDVGEVADVGDLDLERISHGAVLL